MLTTSPHLQIRHPSPTTIEFTVSTAPSPTLTTYLLNAVFNLFRLSLGLSILFLLYTAYLQSPYSLSLKPIQPVPAFFTNESIWHHLYLLHTSRLGSLFIHFTNLIPLTILIPSALGILYILSLRLHTSESLLVLRGLGIQTSSSSDMLFGSPTTRFIPTEKIMDLYINEAFRGFEVRYYLVVVVEGEEEVVVVFPRLLPRRDVLEKVWRGGRRCLWEGVGRGVGEEGAKAGKEG